MATRRNDLFNKPYKIGFQNEFEMEIHVAINTTLFGKLNSQMLDTNSVNVHGVMAMIKPADIDPNVTNVLYVFFFSLT